SRSTFSLPVHLPQGLHCGSLRATHANVPVQLPDRGPVPLSDRHTARSRSRSTAWSWSIFSRVEEMQGARRTIKDASHPLFLLDQARFPISRGDPSVHCSRSVPKTRYTMSEERSLHGTNAINKIKELADEMPICMFLTRLNDRPIPARPMATQKVD